MTVSFIWRGPIVRQQIRMRVLRGLRAVALTLHRDSRRAAGIHLGRSGRASRPGRSPTTGEPPRRRTGAGQKGIVWGSSLSLLEARVGYTRNARHMTFHEIGIRYRRAGFQMRSTIVRMLRRNRRRYSAAMRRGSGGFGFSAGSRFSA
jgi:hypothetical protein